MTSSDKVRESEQSLVDAGASVVPSSISLERKDPLPFFSCPLLSARVCALRHCRFEAFHLMQQIPRQPVVHRGYLFSRLGLTQLEPLHFAAAAAAWVLCAALSNCSITASRSNEAAF